MSTVDSRVVELLFDNTNFERNAKTSIDTLNNLDRQIENTGLSTGLESFEKTANGINFNALSNSLGGLGNLIGTVFKVETVTRWLTTFEQFAEKTVKSLSVDNIAAGWKKLEEKTGSVMTIMSATGKTVDEVNKSLEKLNWFTDETSYSYTDMVSNIGKFTAAGVDLDVAISAMEGIANVAAVSGQNTQAASRAMYNFSQALGQGAVKLMDWKSIENANMATMEFKQTIIDTAIELGNVKKIGENLYQSIDEHGKLGDEFGVESFSKSLSEGWFTSEVLVKSLGKYSDYADAVYEISDAYDTCSEAMRHVNSEGMELGEKAFKAAQEAKTYKDAIEATKDAVSTGWLNFFEMLIGNYEEATELWTDFCSDLWDIFASGFNKANGTGLNDIMYEITNVGVGEFRDKITEAGLSVDQFESLAKKAITNAGGNVDDLIYEFGSLKHVMEEGTFGLEDFNKALADTINESYANEYALNLNKEGFNLFKDEILSVKGHMHTLEQTYAELEKKGINVADNQELIDKILKGQIKSWDQVSKKGIEWTTLFGDEGSTIMADFLTSEEYVIDNTKELTDSFKKLKKEITNNYKEVGLSEEFYKRMADAGYDLYANKDIVNKFYNGQIKSINDLSTEEKKILFYNNEYTDSLKDVYEESKNANGEISSLIDNMTTPNGRTLIVETAFDLLHSLMEIGGALGRAITDIFPIPTAEQFYSIFENIRNSVGKFKNFIDSITPDPEDEEKVGSLTKAFRGLIAIVDIIVAIISPLKNAVTAVFDVIAKRTGHIIDTLGKFGDSLVELRDNIVGLTIFETVGKRIYKVFEVLTTYLFDLLSVSKYLVAFSSGGGGISGVINIITMLVKDAIKLVLDLVSAITGMDLNSLTSKITSSIQKIVDAITAITSRLEIIAKGKITNFIHQLQGNFDEASESAGNFKEKITEIFNSFQTSDFGQKIIGFGTSVLSGIRNVFNAIITTLDDVISSMHIGSEEIKGFFDTLTVGSVSLAIAKLASSLGGIGGIITFLGEKFKSMGSNITGVNDFIDKFKAILNGVTTTMESYQKRLTAASIKDIAISIAILAGALFVLSWIDYKKIAAGIIGLQAAFGDVIVLLYTLSDLDLDHVVKLNVVAKAIQSLAVSIVILAVAMKILSTIDPVQLSLATAAVAALLYELTYIMKELSTIQNKMAKGASAVIALSVGVLILSFAMKNLAKLSWEEIAKGLVSCVLLLTYLATTMQIMDGTKVKGAAAAIIAIAVGVRILAGAVTIFGTMPLKQLAKGIVSCIALILALGVAIKIMGKTSGLLGAAVSLIAIAYAIKMLVDPITILGAMPLDQLAKGIGAVMILLATLSASSRLLKPSSMIALGLAMVPFAYGMNILAGAMWAIGSLPLGNLAKAVITIGLLTSVITAASIAANPATLIALGISMFTFAAGINILADAITTISNVPWGGLAKAGIVLAAVIATLLGVSLLAASAIPAMLGLSAAVLLLGVGFLAVGAGIIALSIGLTMLSATLTVAAAGILGGLGILLVGLVDMIVTVVVNLINSLGLIFDAIKAMLPSFFELWKTIGLGLYDVIVSVLPSIFEAIKLFLSGLMDMLLELGPKLKIFLISFINFIADVITSSAPAFKRIMKTWISMVLDVLAGVLPDIFKVVKQAISSLLTTIRELLPEILDFLGEVITNVLEFLLTKIPEFADFILTLIETLLDKITEHMPTLMEKGKELILAFLDGMIDAIPDIADKAMELIDTFMQTIADSAVDLADSAFEMITNFINGLTDCINERGPELTTALEGLFDAVFNNGLNFIETFMESFKEKGAVVIAKIKEGLEEKKEEIKEKIAEIIQNAPSAISESFKKFVENGRTIITKIKEGITSAKDLIKNKLIELKDNAIQALHDKIQEFIDIGKNMIDGIIEGIMNAPNAIKDAAVEVVDGAVEGVKDYLGIASPSKLFKTFGEYVDEGFAIGISDNADVVSDSTMDLGKNAVNGMKNAISKISDVISGDMDLNPVITPVLDMSNVENGVGRINSMLSNDHAYSINSDINRKLELNAKSLEIQNGVNSQPNNITFNQYNTSPKALSRIDIYRQTSNQISQLRGGYA